MRLLIALSENDKRILIALAILLILIFVIVGYIGLIVEKIMKHQAKKAGVMMHDVVAAKVITNQKEFNRFGRIKNNRLLAKQALIPLSLILLALIVYIIYGAITSNWALNLFDYKEKGFTTLLFLWDFKNVKTTTFFGMQIICDWPPILNTPHFELSAWASYLIAPLSIVGIIWFLIVCQAHLSRRIRLRKLAKTIFKPTLDTVTPISPLIPNQNNNQNNNNTN